jgi:hypothetical protein
MRLAEAEMPELTVESCKAAAQMADVDKEVHVAFSSLFTHRSVGSFQLMVRPAGPSYDQ